MGCRYDRCLTSSVGVMTLSERVWVWRLIARDVSGNIIILVLPEASRRSFAHIV